MAPHGTGAHGSMDMDMGSGSASSSSDAAQPMHMMSIFQTSMATSLYSTAWTPASTGAYAGTCIFLAALAIVFRMLLWGKNAAEARWLDAEMARRYVVVQGKGTMAERVARDSESRKGLTLSENGVEEKVMVLQRRDGLAAQKRPWRLSVDPLRALFDTVIVGVGYMLMLAVMTMNVGYFLSILAGTFVGSLAVGRYTGSSEH
ncbi:Ctr copper transporter [Microdochium bolleyi]|uniref:Copper transport protein n=1 Tax=Microdochium bolleyi TaxID=196109 RepID=A0A136JA94_9PEZI|nr:Ctr copper transporter [Microdochium bolleyi]